ncbi:MAG: hypothetical protein ACOYIE_08395 [Agathobaculum sp.]|uniref:hypothetical protein n=1 Tax=Agathobaculum sp. TaxID=2048138 RepID=UPI003D90A1A1
MKKVVINAVSCAVKGAFSRRKALYFMLLAERNCAIRRKCARRKDKGELGLCKLHKNVEILTAFWYNNK